MNVYNEIEPYAARWISSLVDGGHIAAGRVDTRSVADIKPSDLDGVAQFHTFAGIGVWSYALRLAGWPDDAPVWTGSCPCQPFSVAGRGDGFADERHLWPAWFELIRQCRPPIVFGEQVAGPAGRAWLDAVSADLEGAGYAVGAANLCAAGVGAPHIRQRHYFVAVADAGSKRRDGIDALLQPRGQVDAGSETSWGGTVGAVANASGLRRGKGGVSSSSREGGGARSANGSGMGDADGIGTWGDGGAIRRAEAKERRNGPVGDDAVAPSSRVGAWDDAEWIACSDGKSRPAQPGSYPLAHGAANRVGRLRAYGNAIVAPLAAEWIRTVMDVLSDRAEGR